MGNLSVRIFNQDGRKIFDKEFVKADEKFFQQIDISNQSVGIYLISLYINRQFLSTKIIIK